MRGATFQLNRFGLFPGTPIALDPQRFGIAAFTAEGDMPQQYGYRMDVETNARTQPVIESFDALNDRLLTGLGWGAFADGAARAVRELYFGSGHGAIFKAAAYNPFARGIPEQKYRFERSYS